MKKIIVSFIAVCFFATNLFAQYQPTAENLAARKTFQDDKFGMFIHWGASSVLGHGEWVMNNRNIRVQEYSRLVQIFNPQAFDAKKWVATAKGAGMKYITFITRHHDGFSNWDTKQSDWKITNTPYGKDVLKQLADECHKQGIKLFLYYSLLDWYRSDYQYETGRTGKGTGRTQKSDWESYIRFMKAQLTELLTNYGEIGGIWFDGHWDQLDNDNDKTLKPKVNWHYEEIYQLIHKLQPKALISNNHHLQPIPGEDFQAFEKDLPGHNTTGFGGASVSELPLETCETINNSWGFNITDTSYKSKKDLIQYLVKAAGYNANFLLNIGPMPDGTIQPEFTERLGAIGDWLKINGDSIYGTRGNVIPPKDWGVVTMKGKTVFLHILQKPESPDFIFIPELKQPINGVKLFNQNKSVNFKQQPEGAFIYLKGITLDEIDTILEVELK
ncbi:MAG: alpha-L-fucosidase [Pyrinomonadaceae bacterium]|nr:alpha-L-fucosidase [Pyrinomonadaceae bacterium]